MALTPPEPTTAPMPLNLRYGLFRAVGALLPLTGNARAAGHLYEPITCGHAHSFDSDCPDPEDESPAEKQFDPIDAFIRAEPFQVYGSSECGSAGTRPEQAEERARRNLENGEQTQVEAALAAVLAAGATPIGSQFLLALAVSELEQWLYGEQDYGRVGFIHASPGVAALAAEQEQWVEDGPRFRTPYGTVWSVGGGYPEGTLFISGQVHVWQGSDITVPPARQTFDRSRNQWMTIAERDYAVAYDCLAASLELNGEPE